MAATPVTPPFDWETIARYLAGESPREEAEAVRRWLEAHPQDAALVGALDTTLGRAAGLPPLAEMQIDVDAAWRRAGRHVAERDVRALRLVKPTPLWRRPTVRAAAVIAVVTTGALAWWAARGTSAATPARVYATGVGQRDSVRLPDGSAVLLGPSSRLTVAAAYERGAREVELTGEAFFDVRHDDAHTFTVRAAGATIRDVGTTFVVRTGADSTRVRVAVRSGAVLLDASDRDAERGVVLHAGDVGAVAPDGRVVARAGASTEDDVAWTRGRLVFHGASLTEVRVELRRWYGVELRVADSVVAQRHLVATFSGEPLDRVLHVLGLALGARVELRGDTVTLHRVSSTPPRP